MTRAERRDLYRLLGGILEQCPTEMLCQSLADDQTLDRLGGAVRGTLGRELRRMHADLARGAEAWREIRRDYVALFVGPRKKLAPPWESVYRSPERLVMQEVEREVMRAYAEQRVGFPGMGKQPADHIALEVQFCSILVERSRTKPAARAALRRFLDEHLLAWMPAFAVDIERHARTEFFRGLAAALAALGSLEKPPPRPALRPTSAAAPG